MSDKQNPIACEPCRQKKCKCDRILPVCSQCSDPAKCVYPESGKRGLPQGYITHLESRLAATEQALYSSYSYLRTFAPRTFRMTDSTQPAQSRTAAVNEWSRLPLRNAEDLELWWAEKARVYGTVDHAALSEWGLPTRDKDVIAPTSPNSLNNSHRNAPSSTAGYPREGRAEQLAESEPAVYF
ncbi:hypothetical protein BDW74DRAFT_127646 [Aspergillus multicolor]|uniref:Zn(II)2Cys6 transcription factor domain-containing protein n=1 Tax=Aspergillus multicolor TaxID=41759 RepID=UPI003CCC9518